MCAALLIAALLALGLRSHCLTRYQASLPRCSVAIRRSITANAVRRRPNAGQQPSTNAWCCARCVQLHG
eukprot:3701967-Pleurochrysis_carterae.AAC.1